ncbi:MAG: transcriptional repressor [Armatimonadetes bacterium]|nr:transcriptional repressor [Armatimonadota bacterium]
MKLTYQRMVVFEEVAKTNQHPDAEAVYEAVRRHIPSVSLDTVYRTLWLLRDLGLIRTLGPQREKARFDANPHRHHHFVCNACGTAFDFDSPQFDELTVSYKLELVGQVQTAHVELRGICRHCLESMPLRQEKEAKEA